MKELHDDSRKIRYSSMQRLCKLEIDDGGIVDPSLHITFSVLTAFAMIDQTNNKWFHLFLVFWIILICFSVVLVHQHHLFDVMTGLLLSLIVIKFIYKKILAIPS